MRYLLYPVVGLMLILPTATSAAESRYVGDNLSLTITPAADDGSFTGTVSLAGKSYPLTARADGGKLVGAFTSDGQSFAFTAERRGDVITFTTGRTSYTLKPIAAPAGGRPAVPKPAPGGAKPPGPVPEGGRSLLRLSRVDVPDTLCKQTAATVLIPTGWKLEGGVVWRWHLVYPTAYHARIYNPRGAEQLAYYPSLLFIDNVREAVAETARIAGPEAMAAAAANYPEGASYSGCEIRRLVQDPSAVLKDFFLPRYRRDLLNAKVVEVANLPELAQARFEALGSPANGSVKAIRVRFAYAIEGTAIEEDLYCIWGAAPSLPPMVGWGFEVTSCRAEKGKLASAMPVFLAIQRSAKVDMKWYAGVLDVQQRMHRDGMQAIADAGRLSRYIAARNDEISRMITDQYWQTQKANERVYDAYSQSIRGTQRYTDPYDQKPLELPGGYDFAYMSPRGEVILTNDPLFKPAVEFQEDWKEIPVHPG